MAKQPELLSVGEAAALCGVHPQTVYRWCEEGLIAYVQVTPRSPRRFRRADVLALLEPKVRRAADA
jgi:excisionase family DNA binding protein